MAVVSVRDLLDKKEVIEKKKEEKFELKTSIGGILVKKPSKTLISEALDMDSDSDAYLIVESTVEPNLKDRELLTTFDCLEPTDIVNKLFDSGEIIEIAKKIASLSGYGVEIESVLTKDLKN